MGLGPGVKGRGAASWGPLDGAHDAPGVLRTGRARPHPSSWVPPTQREEGVWGKEWQAQPGEANGTDVRGQQRHNTAVGTGRMAGATACMGTSDVLICSERPGANKPPFLFLF